MSEMLKPCPFCGGKAELHKTTCTTSAPGVFVMCGQCLTLSNNFHTEEKAVLMWNRRVKNEGKNN